MRDKRTPKDVCGEAKSIVDVPIEDNDIFISHRMKSENAVPHIIVKFTPWSFMCQGCSLQSKVEVKEFDYRRLIGLGSQGRNKIFIQESLIPARRELFHKKKCKLRYI